MTRIKHFAAAALVAASPLAHAADWTLTFNGTLFNAFISPGQPESTMLQLHITTEDAPSVSTATYNLGSGYRITSFSGTRDGMAITPLYAPTDPFFNYGADNYLYPNDAQLIGGAGLAYTVADGTLFNLYGYTATFVTPPQVQWWEATSRPTSVSFPPHVTYNGQITLQAAPVPEPASLALLMGGLAVVGGAARRRARS